MDILTYEKDHKVYVPEVKTNVMETFRRLGFVPPSEQQVYLDKWAYYKSLGTL